MRTIRDVLLPLFLLLLSGCSSEPRPAAQEKAATAPPAPVKILHFYASPGAVGKGDTVTMCYGVENASSVALEPPVEAIAVSPNRCIQFAPSRTQTYTLVATGAAGSRATESLAIRVSARSGAAAGGGAAAAQGNRIIEAFAASSEQAAPGQPVTLCYSVPGATSIRIEPEVGDVTTKPKGCSMVRPNSTVTYTLTAAAGGRTEREQITIRVK